MTLRHCKCFVQLQHELVYMFLSFFQKNCFLSHQFTVLVVPRTSTFFEIWRKKIGPKSDPRGLKIRGDNFFLSSRFWSSELSINICVS